MTTIDQKIAELINKWQPGGWPIGNLLLVLLALVLCVVLCGIVGFEREKRGRSAGLRTHLLVGVGSCVIMIISIYGFPAMFQDHRDVARLAAGVITGVGFLGAGAVIHANGGIKGLTTAGTIWMAMAIGLSCGSMNFILAISVTAIVMCVLIVFRGLERKITKGAPTFIVLADENTPVMTIVLSYAKERNLQVIDVTSQIVNNGQKACIETTFKLASLDQTEVNPEVAQKELETLTKAISVTALNHK